MDPWPNGPRGGTFQYVMIDLGPYQNPDPNQSSPDRPAPNHPAPSYRSTSTNPPRFESCPPSNNNSADGVTTVSSKEPAVAKADPAPKSTDKATTLGDKSTPPTITPRPIYIPPTSLASDSDPDSRCTSILKFCIRLLLYIIWFLLLAGGIAMLKIGLDTEGLVLEVRKGDGNGGNGDREGGGMFVGGVVCLMFWVTGLVLGCACTFCN